MNLRAAVEEFGEHPVGRHEVRSGFDQTLKEIAGRIVQLIIGVDECNQRSGIDEDTRARYRGEVYSARFGVP